MKKKIKAVYRVECFESEFGVRSMGHSDFDDLEKATAFYRKYNEEGAGADGQFFFAKPPKLVDLNQK